MCFQKKKDVKVIQLFHNECPNVFVYGKKSFANSLARLLAQLHYQSKENFLVESLTRFIFF